jgi:hypothetical protein
MCAQTEVDAVAENEMRVRLPSESERVRFTEVPFAAVGRALPHHHLRPGSITDILMAVPLWVKNGCAGV